MQDEYFTMIVQIGSRLAKSFTGFSRTEAHWCSVPSNWLWLQNIVLSQDPYEMVLQTVLSPAQDFTMVFQLTTACLLDISEYGFESRLPILTKLIDTESDLDHIFKNTKLLRFLLALHRNYDRSHPNSCCSLYKNANILLAHLTKKFPDLLKMNFFKANSKKRSLRFTERDRDFWLDF